MYKIQNQIEMLEAILEARSKLPTAKDSCLQQYELLESLSSLYACLDVVELKSIVEDFKEMNRRSDRRQSINKKAA